jgi:hypothetical protein
MMAAESTHETRALGEKVRQALEAPQPRKDIDQWVECVGEGWRPLVRGLDANLRDIDPEYVIGQVKEKFGGLRYYIDAFAGDADEGDRLVRAAEELSFKICEDCGTAGERCKVNAFWIRTLCPLCQKRAMDQPTKPLSSVRMVMRTRLKVKNDDH